PCGATELFTHGNSLSANTLALMKNGMYVSLMPWASSLGAHSFLRATIALMSHSSKQCVCAAVCLAFTMFSAITRRTRVNGTVVSRGPATAAVAAGLRKLGTDPAALAAAGANDGAAAAATGAGAVLRRFK